MGLFLIYTGVSKKQGSSFFPLKSWQIANIDRKGSISEAQTEGQDPSCWNEPCTMGSKGWFFSSLGMKWCRFTRRAKQVLTCLLCLIPVSPSWCDVLCQVCCVRWVHLCRATLDWSCVLPSRREKIVKGCSIGQAKLDCSSVIGMMLLLINTER